MSFKDNESEEHFIGILIFAVVVAVIVLTITGLLPQTTNCEAPAYWDGTHYTCHP